MSSAYFVIKTLIVTFVLVLLMQVKFDGKTIEQSVYEAITMSEVVDPLVTVSDGAVVFLRNTWSNITRSINSNFTNSLRSENQPGQRHLKMGVDRSKAYLDQVAKEQVIEARRIEIEAEFQKKLASAQSESSSMVDRFKNKVSAVSKNVKNKFIDETQNPKETRATSNNSTREDRSSARSTNDEDLIETE